MQGSHVVSQLPVLIIDDDLDTRAAAADVLYDAGYWPMSARNGLEALQMLRTGIKPVAMIVDLFMPLMDGEAFCEACDADPKFRTIPRVIMSVSTNGKLYLERKRAQAFVGKPMEPARLIEAILSVASPRKAVAPH